MQAPSADGEPVSGATLAAATARGRELARLLDDGLRTAEREARERRRAVAATPRPATVASPAELVRLRQQVEQLTAFRTAVLRSRPWRLAQGLRRLVGRAW
jgi:hypothetical protein